MPLKLKYFVLNPNKPDPHGEASRKALDEYAKVIWEHDSELADDIMLWVYNIRTELNEEV